MRRVDLLLNLMLARKCLLVCLFFYLFVGINPGKLYCGASYWELKGELVCSFFLVLNPQASALITSGTHTDGGTVRR